MTVVDTSTLATATAYSNQRQVGRCQNGVLWEIHAIAPYRASLIGYAFRPKFSTDDGATWTADADLRNGSSNDATTYVHNVSMLIDLDDYAHVVFKDNSNGFIYYMRGTPNAARTAWTWSAAQQISTYAGLDHPDVVAFRTPGSSPTEWDVCIVAQRSDSVTSDRVYFERVHVSSTGGFTLDQADGLILDDGMGRLSGAYGNTVGKWPSIDFNHTGDGKTVAGATPHLYVSWSAGATGAGKGVRFRKAAYSAGSWTWGAEREIDSTQYLANTGRFWINCMFDGTRVVMAVFSLDADETVAIYERDAADTTTTTRTLVANAGANGLRLYGGGAAYDPDGNVYFFGISDWDSGVYPLVYRKWTRATATLGPAVTVDSDLGNVDRWTSMKRGYSNNRIEFIYTDGAASPYSVTYDSVSLNTAPNAPTSLSPDGTIIDRTATNRFSWTFSDPDAGDSQSKYDLRHRPSGTATWTVVSGTTPNQFHDFAGGTFPAGEHEWQVRIYDAAGVVGPYSASAVFTAATPPAEPSITDPVNGQTIASEQYTVQWSAPSQSAYQVRTVADDAGSPDATTVHTDTGEQTSSSARSRTVAFETNNRDEHVQVRIKVDGLWSTWASVKVTVSYTPPATPTAAATADMPEGAIAVSATHPAPAAGEPTVTSMDVHRRVAASGGDGIRVAADLAPSGTFTDWAVASGVVYEYRVRAFGDNGVSTYSPWSA